MQSGKWQLPGSFCDFKGSFLLCFVTYMAHFVFIIHKICADHNGKREENVKEREETMQNNLPISPIALPIWCSLVHFS